MSAYVCVFIRWFVYPKIPKRDFVAIYQFCLEEMFGRTRMNCFIDWPMKSVETTFEARFGNFDFRTEKFVSQKRDGRRDRLRLSYLIRKCLKSLLHDWRQTHRSSIPTISVFRSMMYSPSWHCRMCCGLSMPIPDRFVTNVMIVIANHSRDVICGRGRSLANGREHDRVEQSIALHAPSFSRSASPWTPQQGHRNVQMQVTITQKPFCNRKYRWFRIGFRSNNRI